MTRENPLWDVLVEVFGFSPRTKKERSVWGMVVKELGEADATPDEVRRAARGYRKLFPGAYFTPLALMKHFGQCLHETSPSKPRLRIVDLDEVDTVPPPAETLAAIQALRLREI